MITIDRLSPFLTKLFISSYTLCLYFCYAYDLQKLQAVTSEFKEDKTYSCRSVWYLETCTIILTDNFCFSNNITVEAP